MITPKLLALTAFAALASSPLQAVVAAPPANDNFVNAIALSAGSSTVNGILATAQAGEPDHYTFGGARGATHSVWWKFTPTFNGLVQIDTRGSDYDTVLAVYTGATLPTLHRVAQDDDSGSASIPRTSLVTIPVTKGVIYRIAVDGISGDVTGLTTLNITTLRINTPRTYQTALIGALDKEDNGLLTLVTTTSSLVTGKLQLGAHGYPFTGAVDIDGHLLASINRPGQQAALLNVTVGTNTQGNVSGPATGSLKVGGNTNTITAYPAGIFTAAAPCPRYVLNRHYNYAIGKSEALGYGVATVTVGITGVCTTSGTLADGTVFAFTSPLLEDSSSSNGNIGTGGSYCYHLP
ncbi:MAG: hlyA 5, partial [Verrucomicrobiaceae bacterium]|nr:hlyA 5 [Verrucomicrobiaceae bacterium]